MRKPRAAVGSHPAAGVPNLMFAWARTGRGVNFKFEKRARMSNLRVWLEISKFAQSSPLALANFEIATLAGIAQW